MKAALAILLLALIVGGGAFGAATMGLLNIPGVSPPTFGKSIPASSNPVPGFLSRFTLPVQVIDRKVAEMNAAEKAAPAPPAGLTTPKADLVLGDEKLAELWNPMDVDKLARITQSWQPNNLARVLFRMDSQQVTKLLSTVPTDRAIKLSQAIHQYASLQSAAAAQGA